MRPQYRFLFLMDPYAGLNLETETSLLLMDALLRLGHQVHWLEAEALYLLHDEPRGRVSSVIGVEPFALDAASDRSLNDFDAVVVRLDPPFDARYLHVTYMLDFLADGVVQFNEASAIRNFNEKVLPLRWPQLAPPSVVTQSVDMLETFLARHGEIVVKPLDDCSGRGVLRVDADTFDRQQMSEHLLDAQRRRRYIIAQKFLPEVSAGDKRVYLVNGEAVGWVNRLPRAGHFLANIHQGAVCEPTRLSERETAAVGEIAPFLRRNGLFLVGVDFIGGYLTEVNLTSPSAVRQINAVTGGAVHEQIVDRMLHRVESRRASKDGKCCDVDCAA
jgi:glutathione synthase